MVGRHACLWWALFPDALETPGMAQSEESRSLIWRVVEVLAPC